ncbi:MAG: hypothetical protein E3J35_03795 [Methanomassiliicoccales archaeon]|nr:MAG: hypothetical protein E3J35_03795 [Methanomassiliicoccales archaeon]
MILLPRYFFGPKVVAQKKETTYPGSISVTYGTATGILHYVVGQDGVSYQVAEEDTNSGSILWNDTINTQIFEECLSRAKLATEVAT